MGTYHHGNLRPTLVRAAVGLAQERGPDGVVLREVARQSGVSHNAAYRHFADRDELLAEVSAVAMQQLAAAMSTEMATVQDTEPRARAVRRLRSTGRAYVHFALAQPGLFEVAFAARAASAPQDTASVEDERSTSEDDPYALLCLVLDELVAVGAVTAERRRGAEIFCWAAVHGFAQLHLHGPRRDVPAQERADSLELLLDQIERSLS